jgi:hypothetical protein
MNDFEELLSQEPELEPWQEWVQDNFPYALHSNPGFEYSTQEYRSAKKCFIDQKLDEEAQYNLIMAFACLIRSINNDKKEIEILYSQQTKNKRGEKRLVKEADKVSKLYLALQWFIENSVNEIVIKKRTKNNLVLKAKDLGVIRNMFLDYYAKGKISNPRKPLSGTVLKLIELTKKITTKDKALIFLRGDVAERTQYSLKKFSPKNSNRIIDTLLLNTGLLDTSYSDSNIQKIILRHVQKL